MTTTAAPSVTILDASDVDAIDALREGNSATLGFLRRGAIIHYVEAGNCLGIKAADGHLVAYLLFASPRRYIRVIHLCVADRERGLGHARHLIDKLKNIGAASGVATIKLSCRRDFPAHKMWPSLGFVPLDEKPTRTAGRILTQWYLGIDGQSEQDLFRVAATDDKVNAVIDAQVFFQLHDRNGSSNALVSKALQDDFLGDLLELYISDEIFVEINRDRSDRRRNEMRRAAHSFSEIDYDATKSEHFKKVLLGVLKASNARQISDIRHLAKTAASPVRIFVTRDRPLRNAAEEIKRLTEVVVLDPTELIISLDELDNRESYVPDSVAGVGLEWRRLTQKELATFPTERFLSPGERKPHFDRILRESLAQPKLWHTEGLWSDENLVAARATQYDNESRRLSVKLCRASHIRAHDLFSRFVIASILYEAARRGGGEIRLLPDSVASDAVDQLSSFDFVKVDTEFRRLCLPKIMSRSKLNDAIDASRLGGAPGPFDERICSPVALDDSELDCFLIPIRPGYAQSLFDTNLASEDFFGSESDALLQWSNVYFRRKSHHRMLRPPARILWYVSGKEGSIRACSHLDNVDIGSPKEMFKKHHRSGALVWRDIFEMCSGEEVRDIMVFEFSHTYLLNQRILLIDLQKTYGKHGVNLVLQSPSKVPRALFLDLFSLGFPETIAT